MSVLFLARDTDGSRVVLKMVPSGIATNSARARLMREARALAVVDHPGVVRVRGTGEHEDMPWIAMDYVNGVDLKRVIAERGPLRSDVAVRYAIQTAEALVAAHRAGVVHRDLKPSNLLLTTDGRVVLVDFGIAKRRSDLREGDVLTSAREVIGTPAYLSPEQIEHGLADERSDVWALGCVLYEMVVGVPPFGRGGSGTTAAILRDEPVFPTHVLSVIGDIVSACLRKSSFARIGSARESFAAAPRRARACDRGDGSRGGTPLVLVDARVHPSFRAPERAASGASTPALVPRLAPALGGADRASAPGALVAAASLQRTSVVDPGCPLLGLDPGCAGSGPDQGDRGSRGTSVVRRGVRRDSARARLRILPRQS